MRNLTAARVKHARGKLPVGLPGVGNSIANFEKFAPQERHNEGLSMA